MCAFVCLFNIHVHGNFMYSSKSYCLLWNLFFAANGITKYVTSPDDDVFISLSKTYSYKHNNMFYGNHCGDVFPDGITNGALWYPVTGKVLNMGESEM